MNTAATLKTGTSATTDTKRPNRCSGTVPTNTASLSRRLSGTSRAGPHDRMAGHVSDACFPPYRPVKPVQLVGCGDGSGVGNGDVP